jgi:hypothetical protein
VAKKKAKKSAMMVGMGKPMMAKTPAQCKKGGK